MKALVRISLVFSVSLGLMCVFWAWPAFTSPSAPPALVRLDVPDTAALSTLAALNVPVHARLTDGQGVTYLLAILTPEHRRSLQDTSLHLTVLDGNARDAVYTIVEYDREEARARAASAFLQLHDDGRQLIGRLRPENSHKALDSLGLRYRRLSSEPITLSFPATGSIPTEVPYDPLVANLLASITHTALLSDVGGLSGEWDVHVGGEPYRLTTRYTYSGVPLTKATQYGFERLQALGYDVVYHDYVYNGYALRNVVAEKLGRVMPEKIVLLTAHLDSRAQTLPHDPAPGADDNASGSAALLQIADILADTDFAFTLRFVLFTGEERGLVGSYYYARDVAAAGQQIIGVLNLDMIAWDAVEGPAIDLHSHLPAVYDDSDRLAALFAAVVATYDLGLEPQIVENGTSASDHSRFWDQGYAALLAIEDYYNPSEQPSAPRDWNPYYHTTADRLSTLNGDYFREFARASLATVVRLGQPLRVLSGTVTSAGTGAPLAATVTALGAWGSFSTKTAFGEYTLAVPGDVYTVSAATSGYLPLTVTAFSVITGTGAQLDFSLVPLSPPEPYAFSLRGTGERWGDAGSVVTHTVVVTNTGVLSDGYILDLSPSMFLTTLSFTITPWVTPEHALAVPVWVTLPITPTIVLDTVTLTVTSVMSPLHTATLALRTVIVADRVFLPVLLRFSG